MKRAAENNVTNSKKLKTPPAREYSQDLGIILSVSLQYFMCHDHLEFDFHPGVNFIIGQNGSGKSAILTGIILALGGKSSLTGRFTNVKGFVKTGKTRATVSVTLKNCGPCAYKPEKYGDKIVVEREISSIDGSSTYKLKNKEGRIVSASTTVRDELTNILIAMDIQIDNPVLILTQETSRNFLMAKTGKEEKLYEFFYKGTGLQKLEDDYRKSVIINKDCENDLAAKKQALDVMEKEVKRLDKLRKSDEKLDELKREAFWARVIEMEKTLEIQEEAKKKLQKDINITKNEAEKSKNKHDELTLELETFKQERAKIEEKINTARKSYSEYSSESEKCASNVRTCQGQVDLYEREERKLLADIQTIEEAINEHKKKDQTDYENEKNQRKMAIQSLGEEIVNIKNQKGELEEQQLYLMQEQSSKHQKINILKAEMNDLQNKKNIRVKELSHMVNSKNNRQYLFGEHTPAVLQEIKQNRHRFKKLPKGPIGLDIEVKDPRWTSAVEACVKLHLLRSFCVDNAEDSVVLTQILKKFYNDRMPSVLVSPFLPHMHNVSQHKAKTNFPTVLDMLMIKDPVIANCLIDQLNIENIILIEDINTAQSVMLDRPPAQCYSAYLLNCDEILLNPYRYYSASRKSSNLLSQTIDESYLEKIQEEINIIDTEIRKRESDMSEVRFELQNLPRKIDNLGKQIVALTTSITDKHNAIEELNVFDEPRNVPEMHDEHMSLESDLEKKQEELREAKEKLKLFTAEFKEISGKLAFAKESVKSLKQKFESLGNDISVCAKHKEVLATSKRQFEQEFKENERKLRQLEREIEETDQSIKKTITERKKVDAKPRIPTERSYEKIDLQIKEMEKVISEQSNTTDKASLFEKFSEKSKRLIEAKIEYKKIEKYNKQIASMMTKREKRTKEIIRYTQMSFNFYFSIILKSNGFIGSLDFSKPRCLSLQATPMKENLTLKEKKACSSLSGGERSFVTIAFLIALWDKIPMPFRILDEYDVFMDSNNRYLSINLLLRHATSAQGIQFIFLSPLDLPDLQDSYDIKVHKMQPPKRIGLTNMEED